MSDIFGYNRGAKPEVVFSNDDAVLTISGKDSKGRLIQGWNTVYRQEVQEIYEIGSSNIYWVRGHPMGQGDCSRIVGGATADDLKLFSEDGYNMCNGGVEFDISMAPGSCDDAASTLTGVALKMTGCVVTQIGFSVTIQDVKINQGLQWRFSSFNVE